MYPRNAASPPRIPVGAVVQISDGAVQTSAVSIKVRPEGGTASAGLGTTVYEEGIVLYTPTQAETDYIAFTVIAYKTGCIPASQGIVTTASTISGEVKVNSLSTTVLTAIENEILDALIADHNTPGTVGKRLKNIAQDLIHDGVAQAGSTINTIVLDLGAADYDGAYDPACVSILSGTGIGQTRNILSYTGATRTAVVDRDWRITPPIGSEFVIVSDAGREHVNEGLAQAGGNNTITLNTSASTALNAYVGQIIVLRSGTGADQARRVASYDGATKIATVTRDWAVNPDATSAYVVLPTGSLSYQCIREAIGMAAANMDTQLTALSSQVGNIASTGAAAYEAMTSVVLNGSVETLTYASTDTANGIYHEIADNAGAMNVVYETVLRPDEVAVGLVFKGRLQSSPATGDNVEMRIYNWIGSAWVSLNTITGVTGATDVTLTPALVGKYTGVSGADVGKVQIGFYKVSGLTSATLKIDQLVVTKANKSRSVGYANGAIWVSGTGQDGTVRDYNGTADNPCLWSNAAVLNATLGFGRYTITPGSAITLIAPLMRSIMTGRSYSLELGNQDISASYFEGVENLTGIGLINSGEAIFVDCHLGAISVGEADFVRCHLMDVVTMTQNTVPYRFHDCTGITATSRIVFTGAAQSAVISAAHGVLTISGMQEGNVLYLDGNADVTFDATCDMNSTNTIFIAGNIRMTNNGANMLFTDTSRYSTTQPMGMVTLADGAHGGTSASLLLGVTNVSASLETATDPQFVRDAVTADPSGWAGTPGEGAVATAADAKAQTVIDGVFNGLPSAYAGGNAHSLANVMIRDHQMLDKLTETRGQDRILVGDINDFTATYSVPLPADCTIDITGERQYPDSEGELPVLIFGRVEPNGIGGNDFVNLPDGGAITNYHRGLILEFRCYATGASNFPAGTLTITYAGSIFPSRPQLVVELPELATGSLSDFNIFIVDQYGKALLSERYGRFKAESSSDVGRDILHVAHTMGYAQVGGWGGIHTLQVAGDVPDTAAVEFFADVSNGHAFVRFVDKDRDTPGGLTIANVIADIYPLPDNSIFRVYFRAYDDPIPALTIEIRPEWALTESCLASLTFHVPAVPANTILSGYVLSTGDLVSYGNHPDIDWVHNRPTLQQMIDGGIGGGGTALTAQETRDALKLAPSAGDPSQGSIDDLIADLEVDDALFQTTLDRLLEQKVDGSLVVVNPTPLTELTLFQYNDYPEMELSLNPQWTLYLDGTYDVFFTIRATMKSAAALVDVEGTIVDQASCTVNFALTVDDMSVEAGKYVWQIQLRKPNPNPLLSPLSIKVAAYGHVYIKPTFKGFEVAP